MIDKHNGLLAYLVKFETQALPVLGDSVVQVQVWRDLYYAYTEGLTKKIFFEILLPVHGVITSDEYQTQDGKRFWQRMLVRAHADGYEIGLVNTSSNEFIIYDPLRDGKIGAWSEGRHDGWGFGVNHPHKRFFIRSAR